MLKIELDTGGPESRRPAEIARMLRLAADGVELTAKDGDRLYTSSGEPAGWWRFTGGRAAALREEGEVATRPGRGS